MHRWTWRILSLCGWLLLSGCATRSDWVKLDELPTEARIEAIQLNGGEVVEFNDSFGSYDISKSLIEGALPSGKSASYPFDSISAFRLKTSDGLSVAGTVALILFAFAASLITVGILWLSEHGGA